MTTFKDDDYYLQFSWAFKTNKNIFSKPDRFRKFTNS